ncbi:MAG TPA: malate synthase A [Bacteroidota bacterium]|nr:malate synthase A [Bacteroidota bacterium]
MPTINSLSSHLPAGIGYAGAALRESSDILSPDALKFIAKLENEFAERRLSLLKKRGEKQRQITIGKMPAMLPETEHIRSAYWRVAPIPNQLLDRRVEFVGPPNSDTMLEARNSDANIYVADFEDTNAPTWRNIIQGHSNLHAWVKGSLSFDGIDMELPSFEKKRPTLVVCPRGLHAEEKHVTIGGRPVSASLFDFGLFLFHNAHDLQQHEEGPYFYIPKIENHYEASLWNDVFLMAQDELGLPYGTIKATVIIESILAALEMHEILYVMRDHCVGLNCGRWNYIFSIMKRFRHHHEFTLPERSRLSVSNHFLRSLSALLIQTCHKRGAHAISGITIQNTIKNDGALTSESALKIRSEMELDADEGYDGTWVLHPPVLNIASTVFDSAIQGLNQLQKKREDVNVAPEDLFEVQRGDMTEQGLALNIGIALEYIASWLSGNGILLRSDSIEHTPSAELARSQLWQWVNHHRQKRAERFRGQEDAYRQLADEEVKRLLSFDTQKGLTKFYGNAKTILDSMILDKNFSEFFTSVAYSYID